MAELTQDPPYSQKVYNALKTKVEGFKLTPEQFEQKLTDPAYQKNVYSALKSKVEGFNVREDDFYTRLTPLKKKVDTSAPGPAPSPATPEASGSGLTNQFNATSAGKPLNQPDLRYAPAINEMVANQDKDPEQMRDEFQTEQAQEQGARDFITDIDRQRRPELYKEQNPAVTFGKSIWNFLSNQLPSSLASAAAALQPQPSVKDQQYLAPTGFTGEEQKKASEEGQKQLLKWADEQAKQGAQVSKELVSRIAEVNDPIDALNWISATLGQATGQIPLSIATGGVSSFAQETGSIYLESVKRIAEERGMTIDQVIEQGLDSPAQAVAWGTAAGLLDYVGAKGVLGSSRKAFADGLRRRAMEATKEATKAGALEGATEYTQTFFEQIGTDQAAGKEFSDAFSEAFTSSKAQGRLEALASGMISGGGMVVGSEIISQLGKGSNTPEQTIIAPAGDFGSNESQQPVKSGESLTVEDPAVKNLDTSDQPVQNLRETGQEDSIRESMNVNQEPAAPSNYEQSTVQPTESTSISEQPNAPADRTGAGEVQATNQNQSGDQGVTGQVGEVTDLITKVKPTEVGDRFFDIRKQRDVEVKQILPDGEFWVEPTFKTPQDTYPGYRAKKEELQFVRSGRDIQIKRAESSIADYKVKMEKTRDKDIKKMYADEIKKRQDLITSLTEKDETQESTQLRNAPQDQGEQTDRSSDAERNDSTGRAGMESGQDTSAVSATPDTAVPASGELQNSAANQAGSAGGSQAETGGPVEVEFEWLGQPKRGTVIKVEKDRVKIKGADGTTYTRKLGDIKKLPASVKEQAQKMTERDAAFTQSVKGLTEQLDQVVKRTKKSKEPPKPGQANLNPNPLYPLMYAADRIDRQYAKVVNFRKLEDYAARVISKGLQHNNYFVRNAAGTLQNIIGGLSYTHGDLKNKLEYTGNKNYANVYAKALADDLYKIIDSDHVSLERVHSVLDPEAFPLEENRMEFEEDYESGTAKAVMNPDLRYEDLNEQEQRLYDLLRLTNDFIHEWHHKQGLISEETYQEHKGKYIARLYNEFELIPPDVQEEFQKSRADFDMFRRRKDINEIDLEILKDPVYATAKRVAQMMRNQAIFEYADAINESKNITVSDKPFPNSTQLGTPGTKPFYGSLTGRYVPNYIAQDFRGMFFANKMIETAYAFVKMYDRTMLRQILKKSKTVYNPIVQLGNFLSNYSFAFWTGVDPLTFSKNKFKASKEAKEQGRYYMDLLESGVIGTDITVGDLRPIIDPNNPNAILQAASKTMVGRGLQKFDEVTSRFYSRTDDISKLSAYISLREDYGYSKDEAIQSVYEGFQNYATVGKLYDFTSKVPVIGNSFIKFKADLARIIKNAITRRPLTALAYIAMLKIIGELLSNASGEDDELKKIRERRPFIPKIRIPFMDDLPMVWQVPGVGEVNFARFLAPYFVYDKGSNTDTLSEITAWLPLQWTAAEGVSRSKDIKSWLPDQADVLLGPLMQLALDRDFRGMSIRDPKGNPFITVSTTDQQIMNSFHYLSRSYLPLYRSAQDMWSAYNGDVDYYGRERTLSQAILNNFIKVQEFGSPQAKEQLTKEIMYKVNKFESYTRDISMLRGVLRKDLADITNRQIPEEKKVEFANSRIEQFKKQVAEKLEAQIKVVKSLEEPKELLRNLE